MMSEALGDLARSIVYKYYLDPVSIFLYFDKLLRKNKLHLLLALLKLGNYSTHSKIQTPYKHLLSYLVARLPNVIAQMIPHIALYNSYELLVKNFAGTILENEMIEFFAKQIRQDCEYLDGDPAVTFCSVSNAALAFPRERSSLDKKYKLVAKLCAKLGVNEHYLRTQIIKPIRQRYGYEVNVDYPYGTLYIVDTKPMSDDGVTTLENYLKLYGTLDLRHALDFNMSPIETDSQKPLVSIVFGPSREDEGVFELEKLAGMDYDYCVIISNKDVADKLVLTDKRHPNILYVNIDKRYNTPVPVKYRERVFTYEGLDLFSSLKDDPIMEINPDHYSNFIRSGIDKFL